MLESLAREEAAMTDSLQARLAESLERFNAGRFRFIFGHQKNSGILFADDSLDVTEEVIGKLNEE
jgi:hypothetical protein